MEGETLESRLHKGALPLDQALRTAIEITSALDKAHRAGIVGGEPIWPTDWSSDGRFILVQHTAASTGYDVSVYDTLAPGALKPWLRTTTSTTSTSSGQAAVDFHPIAVASGGRQTRGPLAPRDIDISRDGKRLIVIVSVAQENASVQSIQVVLSWFEELKRLVPTTR